MKLIQIVKNKYYTEYYYEDNTLLKKVDVYKEITWFKNNIKHKDNGASIQNCWWCKNKFHTLVENTLYNRHFYLNGYSLHPAKFAEKTNHKICLICNDFCNQECFL